MSQHLGVFLLTTVCGLKEQNFDTEELAQPSSSPQCPTKTKLACPVAPENGIKAYDIKQVILLFHSCCLFVVTHFITRYLLLSFKPSFLAQQQSVGHTYFT
jgi:hypothetical protein